MINEKCEDMQCANYSILRPRAVFKPSQCCDPKSCGVVTQYFLKGYIGELSKNIGKKIVIYQAIPEGCRRAPASAALHTHLGKYHTRRKDAPADLVIPMEIGAGLQAELVCKGALAGADADEVEKRIRDEFDRLKGVIEESYNIQIREALGRYARESADEIVGNRDTFDELRNIVQSGVAEKHKREFGFDMIDCFMTEHPRKQKGHMLTHIDERKGWVDQSIVEISHKDKSQVISMHRLYEAGEGLLKNVPNYEDYTHVIIPPLGDEFNLVVLIKINEGDTKWDSELIRRCRENYFDVMERMIKGAAMVLIHDYNRKIVDDFAVTLRHELGQSNAGFLSNLEHFIQRREEGGGHDRAIYSLLKNAKGYAHSTMLRTVTSRYIKGVTVERKRFFYPYGAFLYKWASVYYEKMRNNGLYFEFRALDSEVSYDKMRPKMYAEQEGIEQIAFNLTNNALKYSLPGTKVTLDCRLSDDGEWYQITVSNYGIALANESEYERIFDREYQGSNSGIVIEHNNNGNTSVGVGLSISREIAEAHDGTLEVHHTRISDLCAPYFDRYLKLIGMEIGQIFMKEYKLEYLKEQVESERGRLMQDKKGIWDEMNKAEYSTGYDNPHNVFNAIEKPVAHYKFVLSIPHIREGAEL